MRALAAALALLAAPAPPWIQRAVPAPIVAWREADVLGSPLPEGVAVSTAGGDYAVGVVDSRLDPPEEVLQYDLTPAIRGSRVRALVAGRFLGDRTAAIAVDVFLTRSSGERAWVLRADRGRLRLLRTFTADRIRIGGRIVELRWSTAARSPEGETREVWRF